MSIRLVAANDDANNDAPDEPVIDPVVEEEAVESDNNPVPVEEEPKPEEEVTDPVAEEATSAPEEEVELVTEEEDLSTDVVTLDDIPDETTSAYRFDARCSCFVKTILKSQTAAELLGEDLTGNPRPEHCDKHGMAECVEFCNRKINEKTQDFDLKAIPVTEIGIDVSLGQYICNQIGSHIVPSRMALYAKLMCTTEGPGHRSTTSHLATTGVKSQQRLWCVRGKFRPL